MCRCVYSAHTAARFELSVTVVIHTTESQLQIECILTQKGIVGEVVTAQKNTSPLTWAGRVSIYSAVLPSTWSIMLSFLV